MQFSEVNMIKVLKWLNIHYFFTFIDKSSYHDYRAGSKHYNKVIGGALTEYKADGL